jgi:sarcosine oxidase subunit alpha
MTDVLIVGAGPAGLTAANVCARYGLKVKVIDEFIKPGGRLLGQLHEEPDGKWWNGIEVAERLIHESKELGVVIECGVSVYNIKLENDGWKVYTTKEIVKVKALLLATGAAETALPIPGWTLPGVMSIGAAQVMTNVHRVQVGQRGLIVGINILSVAIARELQLAGIEVDSMLLPEKNPVTADSADPEKVMKSLLRVSHLAPSKLIRYGSHLMKYPFMQKMGLRLYPKTGFRLWGIPIQLRKAVLEIVGEQQVEGVRTVDIGLNGQPINGTERVIDADFVCIAGGLYPLVELAAVAGCPFRFIPELGGHVPVHSENMKTPLKGLYVAGNITGIESAKVAMAQGDVAGFSILNDVLTGEKSFEDQLTKSIQDVEVQRQGAIIQFHPNIQHGRKLVQSSFREHELKSDTKVTQNEG